ncbi:MAG: hypothetical protein QM626_11635 [Microbacterium sp.]|uniref:hypothetical protein n=1 Tax=Microbacterium sp. TaxID=51671 RepID=UPI0039E459C9
MNTPITSPTLSDDEGLVRHFAPLLGPALRRRLWLFFLDEEHRPVGPAIPTDDYPRDPHLPVMTDDLGTLTAAELYGARFGQVMRECDVARVVVIWERRGGRRLDRTTREWARAFGEALRERGGRVRAQLLLHDGGLCVIAPDDLA